ncbi:cell division protein FtsK [Streptacidiphilus sp. ASG 303]|uniref:cell division protein FtsK n=1 Tax=Streptacidiphilus sp. ASG 303 TaxID=2896847 RepID=UPI001E52D651|nr:cell division protein FtsK [Streptacidiphilus sp. ASG 303]
MNHDDHSADDELFARLEADLTADFPETPGGEVVDLGKARTARRPADGPAVVPVVGTAADADDDPDDTVYVDDPAAAPADVAAERRREPILPKWASNAEQFKAAAKWAAGQAAYVTAYHAARSPLYAARLTARAPRGAARIVRGAGRWVADTQGAPMRAVAVRKEDAELYLRLTRQRDAKVRLRTLIAALVAAFGVAFVAVLLVMTPGWTHLALAAATVAALGWAGAPADQPLVTRAVVKTRAPRLTSDIVERALLALGIGGMGKGEITFPAPITRDGPGWRADVDLPHGVTAGDIMERRKRLASGLRRPLGCVWPEGNADEHEGRLVLWVGDKDLSKAEKIAWPLAKSGRHDLFKPVPFGRNPRGQWVAVPLVQHNVLFGSQPGQGKTSSVRVLAAGAALDPTAEMWTHELKGSGDLDPFEPISHRFVSGIDDDSIEYAAESLTLLRKEVMRRTGALKKLPRDLCPDKRVTREIADKRIGLHPLVCIVDECQNLFAHAKVGKQAGEDAEFIIKIGRAFGVILILATQRPDKDSLPTGVSGNVSIRFCLRVAGQVENDMILGTSAYKNGIRATTFRPEVDAGLGYLAGATATPTVVKTAYLDTPATEAIAKRARAMRAAAGTLTGHAAGEAPERSDPHATLLDDLAAVWPAGEARVWGETLTGALAALRPDAYAGWAPEQLAAALRPLGIEPGQIGRRIDGKTVNRRGYDRAHITAAIAERDRNRSA